MITKRELEEVVKIASDERELGIAQGIEEERERIFMALDKLPLGYYCIEDIMAVIEGEEIV